MHKQYNATIIHTHTHTHTHPLSLTHGITYTHTPISYSKILVIVGLPHPRHGEDLLIIRFVINHENGSQTQKQNAEQSKTDGIKPK